MLLWGPPRAPQTLFPPFLHGAPGGGPEGAPGGPPEEVYGMQQLLECIALQAEEMGLEASSNTPGKGVVLETSCSKTAGGSAVVLIKEGTIK